MAEQFSLPGVEDAPLPTDRLFFALLPDAGCAVRIGALAHRLAALHGLRSQPLPAERLHVTLYFLGDYAGLPRQVIARAGAAAASVTMPPFEVMFDRASSFSRSQKRPVVLRAREGQVELMAFQQALATALRKAGLPPAAGAGFTPHVTLLYDEGLVAEQAIEPIAWTVRDFVLVHSQVGRGRHLPLSRWPLHG